MLYCYTYYYTDDQGFWASRYGDVHDGYMPSIPPTGADYGCDTYGESNEYAYCWTWWHKDDHAGGYVTTWGPSDAAADSTDDAADSTAEECVDNADGTDC